MKITCIYIRIKGPNCHYTNPLIELASGTHKKYGKNMIILCNYDGCWPALCAPERWHIHPWINLLFIASTLSYFMRTTWSMKCITIMQIELICMEIFGFFVFSSPVHMWMRICISDAKYKIIQFQIVTRISGVSTFHISTIMLCVCAQYRHHTYRFNGNRLYLNIFHIDLELHQI